MRSVAIVLASTLAATASAEPTHVRHHLSVVEVDAVTGLPVAEPNGIIEPGEGAMIRLSVSFTPPVGTKVTMPGGPEVTVMAFASTTLHIDSIGQSAGAWHSLWRDPIFASYLGPGIPFNNGRGVWDIDIQQSAGATASTANPLEYVWQGVWVPNAYTDRSVRFFTHPWGIVGVSGLWVDLESVQEPVLFSVSTETDSIFVTIGTGPPACYANCDNSTTEPRLTVDDFTCFIAEFAAAQALPHEQQVTHYANCDGSTGAPVLTVDDFTCFINEFAQGCP